LRIKEQETLLILHEHDGNDDDVSCDTGRVNNHFPSECTVSADVVHIHFLWPHSQNETQGDGIQF